MGACTGWGRGLAQRLSVLVRPTDGILRNERGAILMDALIAVIAMSVLGTAVLGGLQTVRRSGFITEQQSFAENIARNQMESVFSQGYIAPPGFYAPVTVPSGYAVTSEAQVLVSGDPNIAKILTTISFHGKTGLILETLRTR